MRYLEQTLSREDYERLLLYLGCARLVLSRPGAYLSPEETHARQMLAELHGALERREQELARGQHATAGPNERPNDAGTSAPPMHTTTRASRPPQAPSRSSSSSCRVPSAIDTRGT